MAAVFVENDIPLIRRGAQPEPYLYVVYSADRGMIVSGYQASSFSKISVPADVRWLK